MTSSQGIENTDILDDQIHGEVYVAATVQNDLAFRFVYERVSGRYTNGFESGIEVHTCLLGNHQGFAQRRKMNGREVVGTGSGNGPIDAAYNTIAKLTGTESELLRFSVSALSGGTDSQGEVTVRLRENGLIALGRGADPDIITASAKAYINGLNRLEYLKRHPVDTDVVS